MAYGDLLSPSKAVEEFQGGIIRCLRVMLRSFLPCFAASCTCKQVSSVAPISIETLQSHQRLKHYQGDECLIAFLQSQDASAAVGHLLSILLQVSDWSGFLFLKVGELSFFFLLLYHLSL